MRVRILIFLLVIANIGCNRTFSVVEYVNWVESNEYPLIYTKTINGYTLAIKYLPSEYIHFKSVEYTDELINREKISSTSEPVRLLFRIIHESKADVVRLNAKSHEEYGRVVSYFSFDIAKDLELSNGIETSPCNLVHYERNYGLSPVTNLLLEFKNIANDGDDLLFTYNDRMLGIGKVNIKIPTNDIKDLQARYHISTEKL